MKNSKWNKELVIKTIKKLEKQNKKRPVKRDNNGLYLATREHFGTWNKAMKAAGYEVEEFQSPTIPQKLTPELSYFLGLLITDGHIQMDFKNRGYKLSLYTSYEEEVKVISTLIKSLFNYKARIYKREHAGFSKRSNYDIHINSRKLIEYLNDSYDIPIGAKSLTVKMPKFILNTSKKNIVAFVRGIIDGDGSIKRWSVEVSSGSYSFLKAIKKILNKFEIKTNKIYKSRTCWILNITKRENLNKLYSLVYDKASIYYPRKMKKFKTVIFKNA